MKTHTTPSIRLGILAASILGFTAISSHAAVVTWGAAQNITGDSDVSTAGSLVGAFNVGSTSPAPVSSTLVNTVLFQSFAVPNNGGGPVTVGNFTLAPDGGGAIISNNTAGGAGVGPFTTLSSNYRTLLAAVVQSASATPSLTLTMSGLSVGSQYQFEWWSNNSGAPNGFLTTATAGGAVTLSSETAFGPGGLGQFALGTFTANASAQAITFSGAGFLNGFQLRQIPAASAVPEPGSALAGLLALGVCLSGLAGRSRRQNAAVIA